MAERLKLREFKYYAKAYGEAIGIRDVTVKEFDKGGCSWVFVNYAKPILNDPSLESIGGVGTVIAHAHTDHRICVKLDSIYDGKYGRWVAAHEVAHMKRFKTEKGHGKEFYERLNSLLKTEIPDYVEKKKDETERLSWKR